MELTESREVAVELQDSPDGLWPRVILSVRRLHRHSMKPRIHIIGGPGSGKSYTALELSARFGVPAYDLDDLFWERSAPGYGVRADATIRDQQLGSIVAQDGWIIEGVYYGWLAPSFDTADMIIALTPSLLTRHRRVITRFALRTFGQIRSKKQESLADLWRLLALLAPGR